MSKHNWDIKMSFAIRLSAMGMLGLALLSSTQWARENISSTNTLFQFFLGVSPNIAAGYAMPLILASFIEKVAKNENKTEARKTYLLVSAFTTFGLIVWEFIQVNSKNLYFDTNDIVATFIGTFIDGVNALPQKHLPKQKPPNIVCSGRSGALHHAPGDSAPKTGFAFWHLLASSPARR